MTEGKMSVAEAFKRLGPVRARTWALLALLAVAALVLLAPGVRTSDVRSETEARLERVLSEVEGAGRVKVMVFEGTDGQTGVLVVAEGARDVGVRLRLQKAVQTVLGIDNARIDVSPMEEAAGGA